MSSNQSAPSDYINHHLHFLTQKPEPEGGLGLFDFSYINLDTLFFSILIGVIICLVLRLGAKRMKSGVPTRGQAALELLVEFIDSSCKDMIHNEKSRKVIAPLGLAIFVWVFFMNAMDLIPVDLLPVAWQTVQGDHHAFLRVVPTADINTTMAMAISILLLCIFYNIKIKGFGGWLHELVSAPFGSHFLLAIPNFAMNIIEFVSKTLSHGMRLFGNMFAGEVLFMVIAVLGGLWSKDNMATSLIYAALQVLAGSAWAIFHILIITLQAYIFMVLTFVYLGQAHDSH